MFSAFKKFGKLGALASSVARAWSPLALWPDGIDTPGMWISPRDLTSQWADYTGTTPVATPGTVADSSNPVGLALDIRAGATALANPGNHMLQSTSAARPLLSARVNLLSKTELPGGLTDWGTVGGAVTAATLTGWRNGITTGAAFAPNAGFAYLFCDSSIYAVTAGVQYVFSCDVRMDDGGAPVFSTTRVLNDFDIFIAADAVPVANRSITHLGDGIYRVSGQMVAGAGTAGNNGIFVDSVVSATGRGFKVTAFQLERGITALPYQPILTDGSTYPSAGFPIAQLYDGVDDSMATAAFAAGTLIDGMDCLIAVRRDSAAACVAGLYNGIADATKFFGMAESASGSGCVGSGAGTPTVWVDNAQLTGGTAVTRGTLHTALTVGDYHILEFRGLDLSTWTAAGFGLYTSYVFPGARGDILLYPSTASTEDKDAARQYLADYYGVTLP